MMNKRKKKEKSKIGLFRKSINYIRESGKYFWLVVGIFLLSAIFGFYAGPDLSFLDPIIKELVDKTENLNGTGLITFILVNNTLNALKGIVLGIFLGIAPLFGALFNGAILGYVFHLVYLESGFSNFWKILPHGIFELPAIFIAFSLGIRLGVELVKNYFVFYNKKGKMRVFGWSAIFIFIAGLVCVIAASLLVFKSLVLNGFNIDYHNYTIQALMASIGLIAVLLACFYFLLFSIIVGKIREKFWKNQFYSSIVCFFVIVLPLLIIAAIIEGILITVYK